MLIHYRSRDSADQHDIHPGGVLYVYIHERTFLFYITHLVLLVQVLMHQGLYNAEVGCSD